MAPERPDDWDDLALRDGLRRLPAPDPGASEFDARVLDSLRRAQPWWRNWLRAARPVLAGAACACVVMLGALSWSLQTPPAPHPASLPAPAQAARPPDMAALDHLLDRPGLSAASLAGMTPRGAPAPPDTPRLSPPPPRRISQRCPTLLA